MTRPTEKPVRQETSTTVCTGMTVLYGCRDGGSAYAQTADKGSYKPGENRDEQGKLHYVSRNRDKRDSWHGPGWRPSEMPRDAFERIYRESKQSQSKLSLSTT